MIITYYGKQFFRIQVGDTVIATNPIGKGSKTKQSRFGADIALVSLNHVDYNGVINVTHGDKEPFVISGPGNYEIREVLIKGFLTKTKFGKEEKINTIYYATIDNLNVLFLGALSSFDQISDKAKEAIDNVDILFVPIAGGDMLSASEAHKAANKFEAKITIPMDYDDDKTLKQFLKESGKEKVSPVEKLTLKRKDVDGKEGDVVVLKSP